MVWIVLGVSHLPSPKPDPNPSKPKADQIRAPPCRAPRLSQRRQSLAIQALASSTNRSARVSPLAIRGRSEINPACDHTHETKLLKPAAKRIKQGFWSLLRSCRAFPPFTGKPKGKTPHGFIDTHSQAWNTALRNGDKLRHAHAQLAASAGLR